MTKTLRRRATPADPRGSLNAITRLALSQACRDLSDAALALVPTFGEAGLAPGSYSAVVRHMSLLAKRVRVLGVLCDRLVLGASWETVGVHLGMDGATAERIFGDMQHRWLEGDEAPWAPLVTAVDNVRLTGTYPVETRHANQVAAELDRYCLAHLPRSPHGVGASDLAQPVARPVSGGLPE